MSEEAGLRRGFDPQILQVFANLDMGESNLRPSAKSADSFHALAQKRPIFSDDLLGAKVQEFDPRYTGAEGVLREQFRHCHPTAPHPREVAATAHLAFAQNTPAPIVPNTPHPPIL